ncbi:hypothetical protein L1987_21985 [Smallanthus sonchifolius]|uniref:Uncharacterized protein n=1 Tax=Smallanthus sonchifolius TaxID=185202 RepID=A0ACB9ICW7_9ASTR|nr:hypothetical protein L1987_21985 [Smallanthus sonchifolius]
MSSSNFGPSVVTTTVGVINVETDQLAPSTPWKVDELEKAISIASRDPTLYEINQGELERRINGQEVLKINGLREELMRLPKTLRQDRASHYDDFITSKSDQQMLLIRLKSGHPGVNQMPVMQRRLLVITDKSSK